ncbi:MAG: carboxypeptidase-like regulatory domain-containing protein [Anaerolineales bacterium]|nr:MAG: carboxypeptidase-like regulatory domain-containing protein [Anaerolineales bacterium]
MAKKEPAAVTSAKIARVGIIIAATLGLFGVIFTNYWQSIRNPTDQITEYFGRVIDINTLQPVSNAKITLNFKDVPPVVYTDSEGIYRFEVEIESKISGQIWVDAENYQPYTRHITISAESTNLEDIRLTPSDAQTITTPPTENTLSPAIQVMDQYYQYINNAAIDNDLSRAWGLMTRKLQCNPSDQCNFETYKNYWWDLQVHYKLYDCGSNIIDAELNYFLRGLQPLEDITPVYFQYTLTEEVGQLKLYSAENIDGISAYCPLAVTYP